MSTLRSLHRRRSSLALAIGVILVARVASADDPRLASARRHHQALDFEKCIEALSSPAAPETTELERGDAEVLQGACYFELGEPAKAAERFRAGLRIHPRALLPPYSSPKIVDAFAAAQADVRAEVAGRSTDSEPKSEPQSTPRSTTTLKEPPPVRTSAMPPVLSLVLGGTAIPAAVVGAVSYARGNQLESEANAAHFESDAYAAGERARTAMLVANVGFAAAVVFAAAAVIVWLGSDAR